MPDDYINLTDDPSIATRKRISGRVPWMGETGIGDGGPRAMETVQAKQAKNAQLPFPGGPGEGEIKDVAS